MEHRRLGQTGIFVSPVGLGTVKLGRNQGVKYPTAFRIPDDREAANLIATALDLGINLIDTAPAYGSSEERLGKLLKGQRDHWIICSKVGEEFVDGRSTFDFSAAHTRKSVERSLKRLKTDAIDLVLVHSDGNDDAILDREDTFATLAQLKQEGKIVAFGMSTKTVSGGLKAAQLSDCVMVTYNRDHRDEKAVLDMCKQLGKGAIIKKALGSGHLALANEQETDPIQENLDFVFSHSAVTSVIIGTINPEHLIANVHKAHRALTRRAL